MFAKEDRDSKLIVNLLLRLMRELKQIEKRMDLSRDNGRFQLPIYERPPVFANKLFVNLFRLSTLCIGCSIVLTFYLF